MILGMFNSLMNKSGIKWQTEPGCFERHLQRRYGNILFPKNRRSVTSGEVFEARDKDKKEYDDYVKSVLEFRQGLNKLPLNSMTLTEAFKIVHEGTSPLIHRAFEISGQALSLASALFEVEKNILEKMEQNDTNPESKNLIERWRGLADVQRNHFLCQSVRKDSPILKEEVVSALLSEDLETIKFMGWLSRYMPDWKDYKEADVMECLKTAINEGYSQERAKVLLNAFREWPAQRPK